MDKPDYTTPGALADNLAWPGPGFARVPAPEELDPLEDPCDRAA